MMSKMLEQFNAARRSGVPLLAIRTADQNATVDQIAMADASESKEMPLLRWDAAAGITGVNKAGEAAAKRLDVDNSIGFVEAMVIAQTLPRLSVLFVHNAQRQLHAQEPSAVAQHVQAVANLRDTFKADFRMLVLLGPEFVAPAELKHDVMVIAYELPSVEQLGELARELYAAAASKAPAMPQKLDAATVAQAASATSGQSMFAAEQVISVSLSERGLDVPALREHTRVSIEQTPGLTVYRGAETFDDLRGLASVKARMRQHVAAKKPVGVVVWIDEGADVFSNVEQDTSGVKTDQQRALLVEMEQNDWRGMIFVGVPGSGKSAVARAFGNEAGVDNIMVDFGGMESKYVGESEAHLRHAISVIKARGEGNAFFVLTCNSLRGIRPQFQRRFRRGVFFFDLPTKEERQAIWTLYIAKYGLGAQRLPDDDGWTGAEIRECCESAWDLGTTLAAAAKYVVPVSRSRAPEIEAMRREAHGRFLDASKEGTYSYEEEPMRRQVRAVALAPGSMAKN